MEDLVAVHDPRVADWIAPRLDGNPGAVRRLVPGRTTAEPADAGAPALPRAAANLGEQITPDWFLPQSPNLLWPLDRSRFLATEIDLDSTLVGGPADLVDTLASAPGLEVWRVDADDDLSSEGDHLNR